MTLRDNSKRRGKYNDLTFEEFKDFCYEYDYISGKGKTKTSYSIDCIDEKKGYTRTNIRVLSLRNNSLKRWKKLEYDWETKSVAIVKNYTTQHNTTQHNTTTNPF